jgi:endoglucanase
MRLGRWLTRGVALGMLLVPFLTSDGNAATSGSGFIRAEGKHLVDGNGEHFAIKGINLGNWLVPEGYMFKFTRARAPTEIEAVIEALIGPQDAARFWTKFRDVYIAKDDIAFIKAAGFNTVRVPLHWRLFVKPDGTGGDEFDGPGWQLLDRLVEWSRAAGLHVILDLHAAPGGQTGVNHDDGPGFPLVFYVPRYRELTIELWRRLAQHYRDETAILGYDLLNEPISPYNDEAYLNPRLEPLYREIVAAIRSVDSRHAVILAGAQWSTSFAAFSRPFDANAIYSYHKFWATPTRDAVQSYVDFSNRWDVPLLIGETGEGSDEWNQKFRLLNEKFGIGWCFWPYKNLDSQTSVVSIREPAGWNLIAHAGSTTAAATSETGVPREQALTILNAYLEAARFANVRVNKDYLASLGLAAP